MFKEITDMRRKLHREGDIGFSVFLNYYFFVLGLGYMTVRIFESKIMDDPNFPFIDIVRIILTKRDFITFVLWTVGFVGFVTVLKQGYYKYQLTGFAMTHVTILTVSAQLMLGVDNLYYGLVWLVLPAMMVICNDIFAYIFGKIFGRTKLIDLSKNKTWEGFIGGLVGSFFFSLVLTELFSLPFMRFMICPQEKLTMVPFSFVNQCELPHIYLYRDMYIPGLSYFLGTFHINEFKVHMGVLAVFASIIAPFGGFFASGVKRAYKIKVIIV
jgi:phosphatidate cytidylyltransferase